MVLTALGCFWWRAWSRWAVLASHRKILYAHTHTNLLDTSHTTLSHTHTTLSHTTFSHTTFSHTHTQFCHIQFLSHARLFHTHTHARTLFSHAHFSRTQLFHTHTHPHTHTHTQFFRPWRLFSFTHSIVTNNSFTRKSFRRNSFTDSSFTHNCLTHTQLFQSCFFTQHCHAQLFLVTNNTFTHNSFTHDSVTHTQLFHTICLRSSPRLYFSRHSHSNFTPVLCLYVGLSGPLIFFAPTGVYRCNLAKWKFMQLCHVVLHAYIFVLILAKNTFLMWLW